MRNGSLLLPTAFEQTMTCRAECTRVKCKSSVRFLKSTEVSVAPWQGTRDSARNTQGHGC